MEPPPNVTMLFDFAYERQVTSWTTWTDGVMGGCSTCKFEHKEPGVALFTGTTSLDNGGGFAAVRANMGSNATANADGIALRVRGDGRTYRLLVSENGFPARGCYDIEFATKSGDWQTIRLPFADMRFNLRGHRPHQLPPSANRIQSIGLLIGDKKSGAFTLSVDWIAAIHAE